MKNKFRYYNKLDNNVPMSFFKFYLYVRLPLSILYSLMTVINCIYESGYDALLNDFTCIFCLIEGFTEVCILIGLSQKKYWGFVINKIYIIVVSCVFVAFAILSVVAGGSPEEMGFYIGRVLVYIAVYIPILIYFEKRKYLFDGAPDPIRISDQPVKTDNSVVVHMLYLDGTITEINKDASRFSFDYKKYLDENNNLYFFEKLTDGNKINMVTYKKQWYDMVNGLNRN